MYMYRRGNFPTNSSVALLGKTIRVVKGDGYTSLTVMKALREHEGVYRCSVACYFGERFSGSSEGKIV